MIKLYTYIIYLLGAYDMVTRGVYILKTRHRLTINTINK